MELSGDLPVSGSGCKAVEAYLDRFLQSGSVDLKSLDRVAMHAGECSTCYAQLANFFRTAPKPDDSFLRETIDELADSLLNFARALMRDRRDPETEAATSGLRIMDDGGGSAEDNLELGTEMIEEAEDFTGSSMVHGFNLIELRRLLEDAERGLGLRVDLALQIFRWAASLEGRSKSRAWNWVGALHYKRGQFEEAKAAFLSALASRENETEVRSFVHCSLAYTYKHLGDLDRAVASSARSHALARLDGKDPFFGLLVEAYARLLRQAPEDAQVAADRVIEIGELPNGTERLREALGAPYNAPIREAFSKSSLLPG